MKRLTLALFLATAASCTSAGMFSDFMKQPGGVEDQADATKNQPKTRCDDGYFDGYKIDPNRAIGNEPTLPNGEVLKGGEKQRNQPSAKYQPPAPEPQKYDPPPIQTCNWIILKKRNDACQLLRCDINDARKKLAGSKDAGIKSYLRSMINSRKDILEAIMEGAITREEAFNYRQDAIERESQLLNELDAMLSRRQLGYPQAPYE